MNHFQLLLLALILDAVFGDPPWLWAGRRHPVSFIGSAIDSLDNRWNAGDKRRNNGIKAVALLCVAGALIGWLITILPDLGLLEALGAAVLIAHKSLMEHVAEVGVALKSGLKHGRNAVSMIVGRDPDEMTETDVARAAIESAAENFSDGVVAPAFWFLLFGLPGLLVYKIVNTADSMIGHQNERYQEFGWAAAKLDDLMNWVPARLTGALICLAFASRRAWAIMLADAPTQRSPNAGWPEAALAGILNVALSGPRSYYGKRENIAWLNETGRKDLVPDDIAETVATIWRVWFVFTGIIAVIAIVSF